VRTSESVRPFAFERSLDRLYLRPQFGDLSPLLADESRLLRDGFDQERRQAAVIHASRVLTFLIPLHNLGVAPEAGPHTFKRLSLVTDTRNFSSVKSQIRRRAQARWHRVRKSKCPKHDLSSGRALVGSLFVPNNSRNQHLLDTLLVVRLFPLTEGEGELLVF
jgi:hypothetical protein